MKKAGYITAVLCALVLGASCAKDGAASGVELPRIKTVFGLRDDGKSSLPSEYEDSVKSYQVFVFNADGSLDACGGTTGGQLLSLSLSRGEGKLACAIANPDRDALLTSIRSINDLMEVSSVPLPSADTTSFVMTAMDTLDVNEALQQHTVVLQVKRLLARVIIKNVTNNLKSSIRIDDIFVSNAPACAYYFREQYVDTLEAGWLNRRGRAPFTADFKWMWDNCSLTLAPGQSSQFSHCFYFYPNFTTEDSSAEQWCPRWTRLVLKTTTDARTFYYPINLNNPKGEQREASSNRVLSNQQIIIRNLKINNIGSYDPDKRVDPEAITFTAVVTPWEDLEIEADFSDNQ